MMTARIYFAALAALLLAPAELAQAAGFPAVTAEERALTGVPGYPNAAAVMLYKKGDFKMLDPSRQEQSSTLVVEARIKILSEQGKKDHGELRLYHSPFYRLKNLTGRTVLPDGRELPLEEKSVFERRASQSRRLSVTSAAFPGVEVGAILDYRYEVKWDGVLFLEPWAFQAEIPVLFSEVVFHVPKDIAARGWFRDPVKVGIQTSDERSALGTTVRASAKNLPPFIDEPYSFPDADLSARFMIVPTKYAGTEPLLDTWASTCALIEEYNYGPAQRNDTAARRRAKEITAKATSPRDKALALFRFVRDELDIDDSPGVLVDPKAGPDSVLAAGRGDSADKAVLLQTLLDAVKLDAAVVWAASRSGGMIDTTLPTLAWFDRALVQVQLDGQSVYLDPADRSLGFGQLSYDHEGTQALVFDRRKPVVITLPATTFDRNARKATITLALDEGGRLAGTGSVAFTGHPSSGRIAALRASESPEKSWREWLEARFDGFAVTDIQSTEAVDERRVEVRFQLAQAEEEVLGDEAGYGPSRPLGPVTQLFPVPPERRMTPVRFDYGSRDEVELTLTWPEGWELGALPDDKTAPSSVGLYATTWQPDPAARKLAYRRVFEVHAAQFLGREDYGLLRNLWSVAAKTDVQGIALAKRK